MELLRKGVIGGAVACELGTAMRLCPAFAAAHQTGSDSRAAELRQDIDSLQIADRA